MPSTIRVQPSRQDGVFHPAWGAGASPRALVVTCFLGPLLRQTTILASLSLQEADTEMGLYMREISYG